MKNQFITSFASICVLLSTQASGDEIYTKGIGTSLLFSMDESLNAGWYNFNEDDRSIFSAIIPFTYHFDSDSDVYNFFATGSIGFQDYEEKNLEDINTIDMTNYTFSLGGGVRINLTEDSDIMMGASYLYSRIKSDVASPAILSNPLYNQTETFGSYLLSSSIGYHPTINNYKPYVRAGLDYYSTDTDGKIDSMSDIGTTITKIKAGVITPTLTSIASYPVNAEPYLSFVNISNDMSDITGVDHFFTVGNSFYMESPLGIDWISKISFDTSYTKGNNFDGFNIGIGLKFGF